MRNQRGYGTQYNWMAIRQELLYYTNGKPKFNVKFRYTDIPKVLKGYYKEIGGDVAGILNEVSRNLSEQEMFGLMCNQFIEWKKM